VIAHDRADPLRELCAFEEPPVGRFGRLECVAHHLDITYAR
jgi:hypothetical protein